MGVEIPYMGQPFNNQCFTLEMKISLSEKWIVLGWHDQMLDGLVEAIYMFLLN